MRKIGSTRARALLAGMALILAACGGGDSGEPAAAATDKGGDGKNQAIKIGVLVPLSGGSAAGGTDMLNAAELAADEINAAGGVLDRTVEIVPGDDGCDPQTGTAAAQKLAVSGVVAIAGGYCSGAAIPETAVLDPKGIPYISAAATNPELTERGLGTVFRTIGRDDQQGPFAARFLAGPAGARKLAILHDNTTYAKGLAEQTRAASERLNTGMDIVFFDALTQGESDYTSMLTKVKGSGADTLYFTGHFAEAGLLLRQSKDLGLDVRLTGGDATNDRTIIETAGSAAEGYVATTAPLPEFLPGTAGFVTAYSKRFGSPPGPYSVYEYDAVKVLADAITRAGSADPEAITEALRTTSYEGLTGPIAFDAKGDRVKTAYVTAVVKDGKFTPHKRLDEAENWVDA